MSTNSIGFTIVTFNVLKVSQSRAIIDTFCQEEGFELTYYIETLGRCLGSYSWKANNLLLLN